MKKTVSFNLEEDIVQKIEDYQKENRLSSRSAALERIILGLDSIKKNNENINGNIDIKELLKAVLQNVKTNDIKNEELEEIEKVENLKNEDIDDTVNDIYGNME